MILKKVHAKGKNKESQGKEGKLKWFSFEDTVFFSFKMILLRFTLLFIPLFYFPLLSIFYFVWLLKNWILNLQKIFSQICEQVKNNLASILEKKNTDCLFVWKKYYEQCSLILKYMVLMKKKCSSVARMHGAAPSRTACFSLALLTPLLIPHFFHVTPPLSISLSALCILPASSALSKMTIQLLRIEMHWQ